MSVSFEKPLKFDQDDNISVIGILPSEIEPDKDAIICNSYAIQKESVYITKTEDDDIDFIDNKNGEVKLSTLKKKPNLDEVYVLALMLGGI